VNPRERILTALSHEKPDHTPTDSMFHHEVVHMLMNFYGTRSWKEVLNRLGIEGWIDLSPHIEFPGYSERCCERPTKSIRSEKAIWIDESKYEDPWGVVYRYGEKDRYKERIKGPLDDAQTVYEILRYDFPKSSWIHEPRSYPMKVRQAKKNRMFTTATIDNPFKRAWLIRGFENLLADYLINIEFVEAIYDKLYKLNTHISLSATNAGVDMIRLVGDVAMQDRMLMAPESWRAIDKPRLARLIEECRNVKPDLFFFFHSDGNIMEIMDDLVEIGFNVINPIQPECMDPVEVKRRWGSKITIHGGVSVQRTLPNGTTEDVKREVETLIKECGYNGGLIVAPSNNIQPDTPIDNIIACFHSARDFDLLKLR
jgi:uroporphyrinogen decarboxylase